MALPSQGGCPCKALAERGSRGETRRGPTLSAAEPPPPLPAAAWPPLLGGRWNQGWQTQVLVCIVVSGVCFLSFENFPWLVGGPPGATSRRDCDGRRRCDEEADGAPGVSVPAHPVPRILVCMGRRRRWAKFPLPGTPFPPFFTWRTPTRPSRPSTSGLSSRKPSLTSQALPLCPPCPVPRFLSPRPACGLWVLLSESVAPADCEPLEGRDQCHVPVCAQRCAHVA